jgi:hypothetical protein
MHSIWTSIIEHTIHRNRKTRNGEREPLSTFRLAKAYYELQVIIRQSLKDFFLITLGIFSAAFGLKGFLLTNHFIDGGATAFPSWYRPSPDCPCPC